MGQYYRIVNLDKKEYLSPYPFDEGAKLLEFGTGKGTLLLALAVLLADGNGRGGGDLHGIPCPKCKVWIECGPPGYGYKTGPGISDYERECECREWGGWLPPKIAGRWKGNRIVVAGDYADENQYGIDSEKNLFHLVCDDNSEWKDVSKEVLEALRTDPYLRNKCLPKE